MSSRLLEKCATKIWIESEATEPDHLWNVKQTDYRKAIVDRIAAEANPPDKLSHQPRLYELAKRLAGTTPFDDDVLFAAAWLHDIGVFIGRRPEDPAALAKWDNVAYAVDRAPAILRETGFPESKIEATAEAIRTHLPSGKPTSFEGLLLRDADILEQLGVIGILRTVCKVGRDTRFVYLRDAIKVLQRNASNLVSKLNLDSARVMAVERLRLLNQFLAEVARDGLGVDL